MFRQKLQAFFEKTPVIHYLKQIHTIVIRDIIVDVNNILLRRYACDGGHCLAMKSLPNHIEADGFTFYNDVAAFGDCCRGAVVYLSQTERQHIAEHLDGILPHMSQEGQFVIKEFLRQRGVDKKHEAFAESARGLRGGKRGCELDFAKMHTIWGDQCIFRTIHHDGRQGRVRCALHTYARQAGLSYLTLKRHYCWFWPLALVPLYTGQFFLTVHTEETRHFTEESESYVKKRCLVEPLSDAPYLYQSFQQELVYVFGHEWFATLAACAARLHQAGSKGDDAEHRPCLQQYPPRHASGGAARPDSRV